MYKGVEMKECKQCNLTFEKGKFCSKCGNALQEVVEVVEVVEMKELCPSCGTEKGKGKFCAKCGHNLLDTNVIESQKTPVVEEKEEPIEPVVVKEEPIEKVEVKENPIVVEKTEDEQESIKQIDTDKEKSKAEKLAAKEKKAALKLEKKAAKDDAPKKKVNVGKVVLLAALVIFIGMIVTTGIYLNTSQVEADYEAEFEAEDYFKVLRLEEFDGLTAGYTLKDEHINYLLDEYVDLNMSLPLGLEITDIFYQNRQINVQVENAFIHTTAIIDASLEFENNQLIPVVERVSIGDKKIGLPIKNMISSKIQPVDCPIYLEDASFEFKETSIKYKVSLDKEYFYNLINEGYESFDTEKSVVFRSMQVPRVQMIEDMKVVLSERDDEALKSFLYEALNKEEFMAKYLYFIDAEAADSMMDSFIADSLYLDEDKSQVVVDEIKRVRVDMDEKYDEMAQQILEENVEKNADKIFDELNDYVQRNNISDDIFSYYDRPYSLQSEKLLTVSDLVDYGRLKIDRDIEFELYYRDNKYFLSAVAYGKCYYFNEYKMLKEFDTKNEAVNYYGIKDLKSMKAANLLHRGNSDRKEIANVVSNYIYSDNSIFINYLKSDGEWAYLIAAPGDYPQSVSQYVLKKYSGKWHVMQTIYSYYSLDTSLDQSLLDSGLNASILPSYDINNYYRWDYDWYDRDGIRSHLADLGKISYSDETNYFSRVDDILVVSYESGKRFIFSFYPDNEYEYISLYELDDDESYTDYDSVLENEYGTIAPYFIYLQD